MKMKHLIIETVLDSYRQFPYSVTRLKELVAELSNRASYYRFSIVEKTYSKGIIKFTWNVEDEQFNEYIFYTDNSLAITNEKTFSENA